MTESQGPKDHTCHRCGFVWQHGLSGAHDCLSVIHHYLETSLGVTPHAGPMDYIKQLQAQAGNYIKANMELLARAEKAEGERTEKPWKVVLTTPIFERHECEVVDVGYADRILTVACQDLSDALTTAQTKLAEAEGERDAAKEAAREALAWRELYTAELALDDMDLNHPQHLTAIRRVQNAALGLEAEGNPVPRCVEEAQAFAKREEATLASRDDLAADLARVTGLLSECLEKFKAYEMDVDDSPTQEHLDFMARLDAAIPLSPDQPTGKESELCAAPVMTGTPEPQFQSAPSIPAASEAPTGGPTPPVVAQEKAKCPACNQAIPVRKPFKLTVSKEWFMGAADKEEGEIGAGGPPCPLPQPESVAEGTPETDRLFKQFTWSRYSKDPASDDYQFMVQLGNHARTLERARNLALRERDEARAERDGFLREVQLLQSGKVLAAAEAARANAESRMASLLASLSALAEEWCKEENKVANAYGKLLRAKLATTAAKAGEVRA